MKYMLRGLVTRDLLANREIFLSEWFNPRAAKAGVDLARSSGDPVDPIPPTTWTEEDVDGHPDLIWILMGWS